MRNRPFKFGVAMACCCLSLLVGGTVAYAVVSGTPEINPANATMQLQGTWQLRNCVGEDTINYRTYTSVKWTGNEVQVGAATDYGLNGNVALTGIVWTINAAGRGVLTATITVSTAASGNVYSGPLTLITQGFPVSSTPTVYARGWMEPRFLQADDTVAPPGDDVLAANLQFKLGLSQAQGEFGNLPASFNVPAYSVETNVAPPPASDGVC
jgi:hypothetical protein